MTAENAHGVVHLRDPPLSSEFSRLRSDTFAHVSAFYALDTTINELTDALQAAFGKPDSRATRERQLATCRHENHYFPVTHQEKMKRAHHAYDSWAIRLIIERQKCSMRLSSRPTWASRLSRAEQYIVA